MAAGTVKASEGLALVRRCLPTATAILTVMVLASRTEAQAISNPAVSSAYRNGTAVMVAQADETADPADPAEEDEDGDDEEDESEGGEEEEEEGEEEEEEGEEEGEGEEDGEDEEEADPEEDGEEEEDAGDSTNEEEEEEDEEGDPVDEDNAGEDSGDEVREESDDTSPPMVAPEQENPDASAADPSSGLLETGRTSEGSPSSDGAEGQGIGTPDARSDEEGSDAKEAEIDQKEEREEFGGDPGRISAVIGGTSFLQAGFGGDLTRGTQFRNKTELEVRVGGKADNGLLYGLKVQLESITGGPETSDTIFDEAYAYLGGRWGRLEFGDTDDVVAGGLLVYAPGVGIGQVDGDYGSFSKLTLDDYYPFYPDLGSATKLNYYTPDIGGFQAGLSYTPYVPDRGQSVVPFKPGRLRTAPASLASSSSFGIVRTPVAAAASLSVPSAIPAAPPVAPAQSLADVTAPAPIAVNQVIEDGGEGDGDDGEEEEGGDDGEEDDGEEDDGEVDEDDDEDEEGDDEEDDDDEDEDEDEDDGGDDEDDDGPGEVPEDDGEQDDGDPDPGQPDPEAPSPDPGTPPVIDPDPDTPDVVVPGEEDPIDEEDDTEESGYRDVVALAMNYQREFLDGDMTVIGSAALMNGRGYGEGFKDFTAWLAGVQVEFAGITVGGGFGDFDGFNSLDRQWNVGTTYSAGPFSIGAQYVQAWDVNDDKSWAAGIGVNYELAPGLSLQGDYVRSRVDFDRAESRNTADILLLGVQLSF